MAKKKITKEGLEEMLSIAHKQIRLWLKYRDDLIDYNRAFSDGTVPPGTPPPHPPGVPKKPSK